MPAEPQPHNRFDAAAAAYERARPGYPAALVDWLVATAGLSPADPVLDLGAGTGELTLRLAEAGLDVSAVEPSERMRGVLSKRLPSIEILPDRAEQLGAEDGRFALVTVANALHWLDPAAAFPEMARVLAPGGSLGIVWHLPDRRDPIQDRLWALVEELHLDAAPYPGPAPGGEPDWDGTFAAIAHERFTLTHRLPRALLPDYVASWSGVANMEPAARAELLEDVRGWSVAETVELPFNIDALLGRRR